ncbi:MFS transporter [Glycomyces harbinensis]|uniref:Major Facilitator Superfamily protein n=1 Tax=Glycomyces harbinensis TaxID=58114 RepID=A0A1G6ZLY5_9ACTN|nr:MFS transporter [Glycomyces harbinensis]SDE03619.1 Major Facilitator Superfamily protein [Glycomyces harbinensis]
MTTATQDISAAQTVYHGPRRPFGLQPLEWALGSCHLIARAGGLVRPMLVLYLTQEQAMTPTAAGAVLAAIAVGDVGSQLLGGWLGDRIGRRRTMVLGFLGASIALVALGSADTMPLIWVAAIGYGLTSELFRPAASAAVADLERGQRVRAYGLQYWAANLGYSIAAVSAGVLAGRGYDTLFWINAAAMLIAALTVVTAVPETRSTAVRSRRGLVPALLGDRLMIAMALIYIAFFTLQAQTFATLPLLMAAHGHGPGTFGIVLALNGVAIVLLQPAAIALLSRRDRATVLAVSILLVGTGGGLAALAHSGTGFAAAVLTWTLGQIGIAVHFGAVFADLAPPDLRSGYMGVASSTWSLGAVFGPPAGTALLEHADATWLAVTALIAGLALFVAQRRAAASLRAREAVRS